MQEDLSTRYLLYLRDMSRQIIFSTSSGAGNYSQVLIQGRKKNKDERFSRITDYSLSKIELKGSEAYRADINLAAKGFGLFCALGILCGTYIPKNKKNSLRLLAAPIIYGRLLFEEEGDCDISEWIVNYDLATCLYSEQTDESEEMDYLFNDEKVSGSNTIREIESFLEHKSKNDLQNILKQGDIFVDDFSKVAEIPFVVCKTPLEAAQSAIEARDNGQKMLYYCPGDWVFNAPVPDGLNTYTALDEIAKELQEV